MWKPTQRKKEAARNTEKGGERERNRENGKRQNERVKERKLFDFIICSSN